ncbi:MAG: NADH-quinone oxidoreductase subunit A [Pseudomonadota bacterium]
MLPSDLLDKIYLSFFIGGGFFFAVGPLIASLLLSSKSRNLKTKAIYECGIEPFGPAWIRYGANYYLYALIFLAFDVDVLYLFPVATAWGEDFNNREVIEMVLFVAILALGIVYAWRKGAFKWERRTIN